MTMSRFFEWSARRVLVICFMLGCVGAIAAQKQSRIKHKRSNAVQTSPLAATVPAAAEGEIIGKRIGFSDGSALAVDEVWKQGEEFWCRTGGVTQRVDRAIQTIDPIRAEPKKKTAKFVPAPGTKHGTKPPAADTFWIYFKEGD